MNDDVCAIRLADGEITVIAGSDEPRHVGPGSMARAGAARVVSRHYPRWWRAGRDPGDGALGYCAVGVKAAPSAKPR